MYLAEPGHYSQRYSLTIVLSQLTSLRRKKVEILLSKGFHIAIATDDYAFDHINK